MATKQSLVERLLAQREKLVMREPRLARHFVAIELDGEPTPFLPIGVFRNFHIFQHEAPWVTFLSSGSTNDRRGQHSFSKDGILRYQKATTENFRAFLRSFDVAEDAHIVSLVPTTTEWPQSSLAAMIHMFKQEGLQVVYERDQRFEGDDIVVFGTSIHHVMRERPAYVAGKNVIVIDTGGTKGRTRNYTLDEVHAIIRETYAEAKSVRIVSEYGMCELSSQAWSLNEPHDGWFRANLGLTPVIVDLDTRRVLRGDDKVGFLAFIDEGNQDSFMAIITEDIAFMRSDRQGCFKLVSRAPDASQKGCSLNVKANFVSTDDAPTQIASVGDAWDEFSVRDLEIAMRSIPAQHTIERSREGQRILMVLSANIPITFLYPVFVAFFRGAKAVHLQLPSIRVNDPTSERVRAQIASLVERIRPMLSPMELELHASRDLNFSALSNFDAVVVFGSDETLKTFAEHVPERVEFIGLGTIQNAINFEGDVDALADLCGRWLGRGCLTPVALVGEGSLDVFAEAFDKNFAARLKAAGAQSAFVHRHKMLDCEAIEGARIYQGEHTFVIDLRDCGEQAVCTGGGFGLVYVITKAQCERLGLSSYNPDPGFFDAHQGKTWSEWI